MMVRYKYKHSLDHIYLYNRWWARRYTRPSNWTIIGVHQCWCGPEEYRYKLCFFGLEIHIWFKRKLIDRMITHDTPNSSNIARLNYNSEKGHLEIEFRAGITYRYYDVDYDAWNKLIESPSAGQYFNSNIRGKYKEEKI